MSANTFPSRPTVEATTAAHSAFSWAYRGEPDRSMRHLADMDPQALQAMALAAAVITAQVEQIVGPGDAWTAETAELIAERLHAERCYDPGCIARSRELHDATIALSTLNDAGLLRRVGGAA